MGGAGRRLPQAGRHGEARRADCVGHRLRRRSRRTGPTPSRTGAHAARRGPGIADSDAVPLLPRDPRRGRDASSTRRSCWPGSSSAAAHGPTSARAELLARQIDAAKDRGDAASIASLAARLGRLIEARGHDVQEARHVYYTGLDWDPKNRDLLDALLQVLATEDDAAERADILERRLGIERGASRRRRWRSRSRKSVSTCGRRGRRGAQRAGPRGRGYPASRTLHRPAGAGVLGTRRLAVDTLAELYTADAMGRDDPGERRVAVA